MKGEYRSRMLKSTLSDLMLLSIACIVSCSGDHSVNPIKQHYMDVPYVGGLYLYNADGVATGVWRQPAYLSGPRLSASQSTRAYPVPAVAVSVSIRFGAPGKGAFWLWVVKAVGPADIEEQLTSLGGAGISVPPGMPVGERLEDVPVSAGSYNFVWNAQDDEGRPLPSGFYRVFVHFQGEGGGTLEDSRDILFVREWECESIPWELREIVFCQ